MSIEQITVADGKYTVTNDRGVLKALRHGEPWDRYLVGDNLVYWMFVRIRELEAALAARSNEVGTSAAAHGSATTAAALAPLSDPEASAVIEGVNASCAFEPYQWGYVRELISATTSALLDKAQGRAFAAPPTNHLIDSDDVSAPLTVNPPHPEWSSNWPMSKCLHLAQGWTSGIDVTSPADDGATGPQWRLVMAMLLNDMQRLASMSTKA